MRWSGVLRFLFGLERGASDLGDGAFGLAPCAPRDTFVAGVHVDDGFDALIRARELRANAPRCELGPELDEQRHHAAVGGVHIRQIEHDGARFACRLLADIPPDGCGVVHANGLWMPATRVRPDFCGPARGARRPIHSI